MVIDINGATTIAELELLCASLAVKLSLQRVDGMARASCSGSDPSGTHVVESATGESIAEAARCALQRWCMRKGWIR